MQEIELFYNNEFIFKFVHDYSLELKIVMFQVFQIKPFTNILRFGLSTGQFWNCQQFSEKIKIKIEFAWIHNQNTNNVNNIKMFNIFIFIGDV